jgi:hypothetical protein
MEELTSKSQSLNFQTYFHQSLNQKYRNSTGVKSTDGIEGLIKDVYDFMHKNDATKLFRECEVKLERFEQNLKQTKYFIRN